MPIPLPLPIKSDGREATFRQFCRNFLMRGQKFHSSLFFGLSFHNLVAKSLGCCTWLLDFSSMVLLTTTTFFGGKIPYSIFTKIKKDCLPICSRTTFGIHDP
ncbi:hypothetical protein AMTRI_Chr03g52960 [Amborella trichopoda]